MIAHPKRLTRSTAISEALRLHCAGMPTCINQPEKRHMENEESKQHWLNRLTNRFIMTQLPNRALVPSRFLEHWNHTYVKIGQYYPNQLKINASTVERVVALTPMIIKDVDIEDRLDRIKATIQQPKLTVATLSELLELAESRRLTTLETVWLVSQHANGLDKRLASFRKAQADTATQEKLQNKERVQQMRIAGMQDKITRLRKHIEDNQYYVDKAVEEVNRVKIELRETHEKMNQYGLKI
jgi:hypothetical protein